MSEVSPDRGAAVNAAIIIMAGSVGKCKQFLIKFNKVNLLLLIEALHALSILFFLERR